MNTEDIIRMAREAWLMDKHDCSDDWFVRADIDEKNIFEFAALVAAHEREAVLKLADELGYVYADDIRARGEDMNNEDEEFTREQVVSLLLEAMDWTYVQADRDRPMTDAEKKAIDDIRTALTATIQQEQPR